jgi:ribosomal protein S12 methylthiotransferase
VDLAELERFLEAARLDAVGVFGYSDEDGTEAATLPGKVRAATVRRRVERVAALVDQLCSQRADERMGDTVDVMIDVIHPRVEGRADHQAPEVDGSTSLIGGPLTGLRPGDLVRARVIGSEGVDLVAEPVELLSAQRSGASRRRGASKSARH